MAAAKKSAKTTRSPRSAGSRAAPRRSIASPTRPTTPADTFTSEPVDISFAGDGHRFDRIDLQIEGIAHGESSYEGRIFLANGKATGETPCALTDGYAGSFHIFGHGSCVGGPGHCTAKSARRDPTDLRRQHPLTPVDKSVEITDAVRELAKANNAVTVTIVPVVGAANALCDTKNVFKCTGLRIVSYNG